MVKEVVLYLEDNISESYIVQKENILQSCVVWEVAYIRRYSCTSVTLCFLESCIMSRMVRALGGKPSLPLVV